MSQFRNVKRLDAVYHDIDVDGVVSGALFARLLHRMGIDAPLYGMHRDHVHLEPQKTYVLLDLPVEGPLVEQARVAKVFVVDHHPGDCPHVCFNPHFVRDLDVPPFSIPTSVLVYVLLGEPPDLEWLAATGAWADAAHRQNPSMWNLVHKWNRTLNGRLAQLVERIDAGLHVSWLGPDNVREILLQSCGPKEILKHSELTRAWEVVNETVQQELTKILKNAGTDTFIFHIISTNDVRGISGSVASKAASALPGRIVIAVQIEKDVAKVSLRVQSDRPRVHLGNIAAKAAERFGGRGGGHPHSAGVRISPEQLEEFRKWIEAELRRSTSSV